MKSMIQKRVLVRAYFTLEKFSKMLVKSNILKKFIKSQLMRTFNWMENNNNCDFKNNGEKLFIDNLFDKVLIKDREKEKIIFDVGANTGEYSQMILDISSRKSIPVAVHLFEPTEKCFQILEDKYLSSYNVFLNKFGLSNVEGVIDIYYDEEKSGLASLHKRNLSYYNIELSNKEEISIILGENYIIKKKINHINLLKLDIEGHELKALEGFGKYLSGDFIDFIQFEYGGANLDSHTSLMEIYEFLTNRNFKIAKVMPEGLEFREYKPYMDNFNYSNYVAVSNKIFMTIQ